jgi:hypothetical protein
MADAEHISDCLLLARSVGNGTYSEGDQTGRCVLVDVATAMMSEAVR